MNRINVTIPPGFVAELEYHHRRGHRMRCVHTTGPSLVVACSCQVEIMTMLVIR